MPQNCLGLETENTTRPCRSMSTLLSVCYPVQEWRFFCPSNECGTDHFLLRLLLCGMPPPLPPPPFRSPASLGRPPPPLPSTMAVTASHATAEEEQTLFQVLGLEETSTEDDVKKAFRKLVRPPPPATDGGWADPRGGAWLAAG